MGRHERTLRHLAFFEALARGDEGEPEWAEAAAGLVVLRLVDAWVEDQSALAGRDAASVGPVREAIAALPADEPLRALLDSVVTALERTTGDLGAVASRLMAYARALDVRGAWALAADVYEAVLEHAHPLEDVDVATQAGLRLGYCARMLGAWDAAREAYERAGERAVAAGDHAAGLRSRIGLANIARGRGNLPEAAARLDAVIAEAAAARLEAVHGAALHDRAAVAHARGDAAEAIRFAHEALRLVDGAPARDRLLADIATFFAELGVRSAARDAHLVVARTALEQYARWSSALSLLELAVTDGAAEDFASYRAALAGVPLPPELRVHYHLYVARGARRFARDASAALAEAEAARALAEERGLHQLAFEADGLVAELRAAARRRTRPLPAVAPAAEASPPESLREIVRGLATMRAAVDATGAAPAGAR